MLPPRSAPNADAEYTLGPFLIGMAFDLALQGFLAAQLIFYFSTFPEDGRLVKIYVGVLGLASFLRSGQIFASLWVLTIRYFGLPIDYTDPNMFNRIDFFVRLLAVTGSTMTLYIQAFFIVRLYRLARWWPLVVVVGLTMVISWGATTSIVVSYFQNNDPNSHHVLLVRAYDLSLTTLVAADVMLTCSTTFFLLRSRKQVMGSNIRMIDKLIRLTIQSAAPATLVTVVVLIFAHEYPETYPISRPAASAGLNIVTPKVFACSMMWTLNMRDNERRARMQNCTVHYVDSHGHTQRERMWTQSTVTMA